MFHLSWINFSVLAVKPGPFYLTRIWIMECVCTILFEDPFWIALFEVIDDEGYRAARYIFGSLPNESELIQFAKNQYYDINFSQPVLGEQFCKEKVGFKRRQRENHRFLVDTSRQKYAWSVLQLELEQHKKTRSETNREEKATAEREAFLARQLHKKEKHRGH
jgi:hypothetical protein